MANIPLLYPGCTAQEILDTINALIAAITGGAGRTMSYSELENKPTVNGVVIEGDLTTENLLIAIADTAGYDAMLQALATKAYADTVKSEALASALNAVNAALAGKLDKDLGNIEAVNNFANEAYIPIVTNSGVFKIKIAEMAAYTELQNLAARNAADTALSRERRVLELSGLQNGRNPVYTVSGGYKTGTSTLYLNGQLLAEGRDYEETDSQTVTMLTYLPEESDILLFRAVPMYNAIP